jgi:hypothetical protein
MRRITQILVTACVLIAGGCKEAVITYPAPYNESDFTVPAAAYTSATAALSVNRSGGVVYVGEEFEIKVALYNMPETLFAASMDVRVPANCAIERVIRNPEYIGSSSNTIAVELASPQLASFGVSYRRSTSPHIGGSGVLFKLICKAVATGDTVRFTPSNADFRITRKNIALSPTSLNAPMTIATVAIGVKVSDEFSR